MVSTVKMRMMMRVIKMVVVEWVMTRRFMWLFQQYYRTFNREKGKWNQVLARGYHIFRSNQKFESGIRLLSEVPIT